MIRVFFGSLLSFAGGGVAIAAQDWVIGIVGIASGIAIGLTGIYQTISNNQLKSVQDSLKAARDNLRDLQESVRSSLESQIVENKRLHDRFEQEVADHDATRKRFHEVQMEVACACVNRDPTGRPVCLTDPPEVMAKS